MLNSCGAGSDATPSADAEVAVRVEADAAARSEADASTQVDAGRDLRAYVVARTCEERRYGADIVFAPLQCAANGVCLYQECRRPEDCTKFPFGRCLATGEGHCVYPGVASSDDACVSDADCIAHVMGGRCTGQVSWASCQYNNRCNVDTDCPDQHICACDSNRDRFCAFVGCTADGDCEAGEKCLRTNPCGFGPYGDFRCTTPRDACEPYAADTACTCDYSVEQQRWRCIDIICD